MGCPIVRQDLHLRTINHGIYALPRQEIRIVEGGEFWRCGELTLDLHLLAVLKIGGTRRLHEEGER